MRKSNKYNQQLKIIKSKNKLDKKFRLYMILKVLFELIKILVKKIYNNLFNELLI